MFGKESILFIKTFDRNSGVHCVNSVYYRPVGDKYLVVATNEDDDQKPAWYLNLKEEPMVEIEIDGFEHFAMAETPVRKERMKIWPLAEELAQGIEKRVPRNVSAVILTPCD